MVAAWASLAAVVAVASSSGVVESLVRNAHQNVSTGYLWLVSIYVIFKLKKKY